MVFNHRVFYYLYTVCYVSGSFFQLINIKLVIDFVHFIFNELMLKLLANMISTSFYIDCIIYT